MAALEILTYPDERLRQRAEPVKTMTDELRSLANDMAETMYAEPGIGLAATQVGSMVRILVVDVDFMVGGANLIVLVNPEYVSKSGSAVSEEGCLSLPNVRENVERATHIVVSALDENGSPRELEADGLLATAIQHEMDHLDGVLMLDHFSFLKRKMVSRGLIKRKGRQ